MLCDGKDGEGKGLVKTLLCLMYLIEAWPRNGWGARITPGIIKVVKRLMMAVEVCSLLAEIKAD
jgi:hypothetical protein